MFEYNPYAMTREIWSLAASKRTGSERCKALTASGTRCRWTAAPGNDLCGVHMAKFRWGGKVQKVEKRA